jgi:2-methylisocitrate lyase-like PEP mutase family enzyme
MRQRLGERLRQRAIVIAPGVYDAFSARLVERAGFEAAYLSGAGVSYSLLARPDIGLVSLGEMVERVASAAAAAALPLIADGDNGHGNALNAMRTVQLFERAGAAAVQFEDQGFPKRCGHLGGKSLVPVEEMVGKLRAACAARRSRDFLVIGRTDARSVLGLDEALRRARCYREAGADLLFVEAPADRDELAEIARALHGTPLVANMVEGGKTPLVPAAELEEMGYALVIYPNSLLRRFAAAGTELLGELRSRGSTSQATAAMCSFDELNELLGLAETQELEARFVASAQAAAAPASTPVAGAATGHEEVCS